MAGHSKWANIKHRKGAQDAARAKVFAKLSKEIMVAATQGGPDVNSNSSLRLAISKARARSMPKKNIESAISKAASSDAGANFKEIYYGANVSGVAFLIHCLTDNTKRLAANIQSYFHKVNGSVSSESSVSYIFKRKGVLQFEKTQMSEEKLTEISLELGVLDFETTETSHVLYTNPSDFSKIKDEVEKLVQAFELAETSFFPTTTVELPEEKEQKILKFVNKVEDDDDDVQGVYHNLKLRQPQT